MILHDAFLLCEPMKTVISYNSLLIFKNLLMITRVDEHWLYSKNSQNSSLKLIFQKFKVLKNTVFL